MSRPLLTPHDANAQTRGGGTVAGYEGVLLNLAPFTKSGQGNVCPFASPYCAAGCYDTAGYGRFDNIQQARLRRTRLFWEDRAAFLAQLVREIAALERRAARNGRRPIARLNNSSDLRWERFPVVRDGQPFPSIMHAFPDIQFYDYTKIPRRRDTTPDWPANYHLTFSLSENNDAHAAAALAAGLNLAVVLAGAAPWPAAWSGYPVLDGNASDLRFLDPAGGHIVALRPRGVLVARPTAFVRGLDDRLDPARPLSLAAALPPADNAGAAYR